MEKAKCWYGIKIFFKVINVFELENPDLLVNTDYNYLVSISRVQRVDDQEEEVTVSFYTNGSVKVFTKNSWQVSPIAILSYYFGHVKGFIEVKDRQNKVVKFFLPPSFNNPSDDKHLISIVIKQIESLDNYYNAAHLELAKVVDKKIASLDKDEVTIVPLKEIDEMISNTRNIIDKYHALSRELPEEYGLSLKDSINNMIELINEKYKLKPL